MFGIRVVTLRLKSGINPFTISHPSEAGFAVGEVALVVLILRAARLLAFPLPGWADAQIVNSGLARALGAVLIGGGLFLFALALIAFGKSWRIGIDRRTPSALVTGGIFRFSRNPIFLFLDLYVVGTFFINGTAVFLIAAILSALFLHFQILREERFLLEHYGDAYRKYYARTPRYFAGKF